MRPGPWESATAAESAVLTSLWPFGVALVWVMALL